jgi:mannose-6-phosphate isomerase-like protein (cupin superfamily)
MEIDKISAQILRAVAGDGQARPESLSGSARRKRIDPASADHWTPPVLIERTAYLRKLARASDGQASETLREYPRHRVMLSFRSRNGEVEVHEHWADLFLVLSGAAALVTGGTVVSPRLIAPGETRGDSIEGGHRQELRPGEIVHVPAGTPHQFLVSGDRTIACLVLKMQESE